VATEQTADFSALLLDVRESFPFAGVNAKSPPKRREFYPEMHGLGVVLVDPESFARLVALGFIDENGCWLK
jgi:hypothetical protein